MAEPRAVWLLRHPLPVLLVLAVATAAALAGLPRLRFDFTPQQLFEAADEDATLAEFEEARRLFGRDDGTLLVVLDAGEGGDALARPCRDWLRDLAVHFAGEPFVERSLSVGNAVTARSDADGDVRIGSLDDLPAAALLADGLLAGTFFSRDRRYSAAWIAFDDDHRDIEPLRRAVGAVGAWVEAHPPPPGTGARLGGIPRVRVDVADSLRRDQLRFIPLASAVLMILLGFTFRRLPQTLLPQLTVCISIIWALGLMGWLGVPVDILTNALPPLLLVIGVSDCLHLLARDAEEAARPSPPPRLVGLSRTVRVMAMACLLTSLTTAAGFSSLAVSHTAILRRFGLTVAAGVLGAYLATLGVLPQALRHFRPAQPSPAASRLFTGIALACGRLALRRPRAVVAVTLALAAGLGWIGLARVYVNLMLTEVYPADHEVSRLQKIIDTSLGGVVPVDVVLSLPEPGGHRDPDTLRRLALLQGRIARLDGVASTRSAADLLGSVHRALAGPGGGELPDSAALAAQEWLVAELGEEPLPLDRFVADDGQRLRIFLRMADVGGRRTLQVLEAIESAHAEVFSGRPEVRLSFGGDGFLAARNLSRLIRDLLASLTLAGAIIFVTLLVALRDLRLALCAIPPNVCPLLATVGAMGLTGLDLTVTNVVVFSIALGLAVDDTIHVAYRYREEQAKGGSFEEVMDRTLPGTGQAVVLTSLLLAAGLLVLLTSDFVPTRRFGALTCLTLAVALLADLLLLPALLMLTDRSAPEPATPPEAPSGAPPAPSSSRSAPPASLPAASG